MGEHERAINTYPFIAFLLSTATFFYTIATFARSPPPTPFGYLFVGLPFYLVLWTFKSSFP
ncbi:MAG: hypothetical protein ABSF83_09975 [Nitrososphaerales archaeon]|jgi:hypothetical protein